MAVITLLTDFGLADEYAGVMKGVILGVCPAASIVDISHLIEPQDTAAAARMILSSYRFFPEGSVHVIVVDPGVGSGRRIIAAEYDGHVFMAPDNGIIPFVIRNEDRMGRAVYVDNGDFFLKPVSATFHGRDIFAPVAARIASGTPLKKAGTLARPQDWVRRRRRPAPRESGNALAGRVACLDRFGNMITDIDTDTLNGFLEKNPGKTPVFTVGDHAIRGLSPCYAAADVHAPLAISGSRGFLEIAVNRGNARERLGARKDDAVRVFF
jgi:S-adenosyl-L-methionine hydrolase (adenosine-forming)